MGRVGDGCRAHTRHPPPSYCSACSTHAATDDPCDKEQRTHTKTGNHDGATFTDGFSNGTGRSTDIQGRSITFRSTGSDSRHGKDGWDNEAGGHVFQFFFHFVHFVCVVFHPLMRGDWFQEAAMVIARRMTPPTAIATYIPDRRPMATEKIAKSIKLV